MIPTTVPSTVWAAVILIVAVYFLHTYRRTVKSLPEGEDTGSFLYEFFIWLRIDFKTSLAFFGFLAAAGAALAKTAGFSVIGFFQLDPTVVADLGVVALAALGLGGVELPPIVWAAVIAGLFGVTLLLGNRLQTPVGESP